MSASPTAGSSRTACERSACRRRRSAPRRPSRCPSTRSRCRAGTASPTSPRRSLSGRCWACRRQRHPGAASQASPASSIAWSRSPQIDGVRYVNDSQGTQPDAVIAALRSFPKPAGAHLRRPLQGHPHGRAGAVVAERATAAVLIGESGPELGAAFRAAGLDHVEQRHFHGGGGRSRGPARPGCPVAERRRPATVLLSPAAASFDMFPDYAARGRAFKARCRLVAARAADAERGQHRAPPMTANARPRSAASRRCPRRRRRRSCATDAVRPARGDRPAERARTREPGASGDRRRQASPRSASVPVAPVDAASLPRPSARDIAAGRTVKGPVRERHEADPGSLATVALAAIGVLMIYSAPARRRCRRQLGATCPRPSRRSSSG